MTILIVILHVPANYYNFIHFHRVFPKLLSCCLLFSLWRLFAFDLQLWTTNVQHGNGNICAVSLTLTLSLRVLCVLAAAWLPFCLCAVGLTVAVTKSLLCTFVFCCALLISNCVSLALALSASLSLTLHVSLGQSVIVLGEAFQGISIRDALLKYAAAFCGSNLVEPFRRLPLG